MISLIKQFKDKCEQEYQAYFEATKITTDMRHEEMLLKMEQTKDLKMSDHREEEKEFYKNLNYEQWLNEIKFDVSKFIKRSKLIPNLNLNTRSSPLINEWLSRAHLT